MPLPHHSATENTEEILRRYFWTDHHAWITSPLYLMKCSSHASFIQQNGCFYCWFFCHMCGSVTHTHTHPFNGSFSGTTRVSRYQKGKTNLDFAEARDSEWQWHQLGHMQVCTSLQIDNNASTGRMPFLPPNQQRQSTEGIHTTTVQTRMIDVQKKFTPHQQKIGTARLAQYYATWQPIP